MGNVINFIIYFGFFFDITHDDDNLVSNEWNRTSLMPSFFQITTHLSSGSNSSSKSNEYLKKELKKLLSNVPQKEKNREKKS